MRTRAFKLKRSWLMLIFLLMILVTFGVGSVSYLITVSELNHKGELILQNAVDSALMVIATKQAEVLAGGLSLEEAQRQVKNLLMGDLHQDGTREISNRMGLGENGYLIILDRMGSVLLHPTEEGKNAWLYLSKEASPHYFIQEQIEKAEHGGGVVRFRWYLPSTEIPALKMSYSKSDPAWGWVIVSTAYAQDFNQGSLSILWTSLVCGSLFFIIIGVSYAYFRRYELENEFSLYNTLPHGFLYYNQSGNITAINPSAERILEVQSEKLIGSNLSCFLGDLVDLNDEHIQYENDPIAVVLETGKPVKDAIVGFKTLSNGTRKWLKINAVPLMSRDGRTRQAYVHLDDVTDQIGQELELRRLSIAMMHSPISVGIMNNDGCLEYVNKVFEESSGYTSEELLGQTAGILGDQGMNTGTHDALWQTVSKGNVWRGDFVNKRKNGERYIESAVVAPLMNDKGVPTHFVAVKEDVTEIRKTQKRLASTLKHLEQLVKIRTKDAVKARDLALDSMAILSEFRDNETGAHIQRTKQYVKALLSAIRDKLPYSESEIEQIWKSAPLHDIGKVAIPDSILLKPGKLTAEEYDVMKTHVLYGHEVLERAELLHGNSYHMRFAKEITLGHHEKWDGTGYPHGLKGAAIPLSARIMAIADVYDALRSERPYKMAFSHSLAVEIIVKDAGKHFDPMLVNAFVQIQEVFESISLSHTDQ